MAELTDISRRSKGLKARKQKSGSTRPIKCQICKSKTVPGLDLGHQPVSDLLVSKADLNKPETFYPMRLQHCDNCGLTQLSYIVDPRIVYKHFPFVSGTTVTATRHLQSLPPQMVERAGLHRDFFAVDIGSNDGTLLKGYIPYGVKFLGVDPSGDPVRIANEHGIPTLHAFFNEETSEHILKTHGYANAITAAGVFGHMADLTGVMKGVTKLLAPRGIFATDNQYWLDMVQRLHYDNMFHQHLRYYSLKPLIYLFNQYEMDVFDVERSDVYGGSIRVFSCHRGQYDKTKRLIDCIYEEEQAGLYQQSTYENFARSVEDKKRKLFSKVYNLVTSGKRVIGLGAPAKAATVCVYCHLGPDLIDYVTEVNPLRIGMYLPGVHIPIVEEERMFQEDPQADAGILFAWNYYDEIVPKLRDRGFRGEVICP